MSSISEQFTFACGYVMPLGKHKGSTLARIGANAEGLKMNGPHFIPFSEDELLTEQWLPIPEYVGTYDASDLGRVRSLSIRNKQTNRMRTTPKFLRIAPAPRNRGHQTVSLYRNGIQYTDYVYRLVLYAFVGPCPEGFECAHGDGNPYNNRLWNLEWVTRPVNSSHRNLHGTDSRGEKSWNARLTPEIVALIRSPAYKSASARVGLAESLGVHRVTVNDVFHRRTWRHLP